MRPRLEEAAAVEYGVLGALEVRDGARQVPVGSAQQRIVLAVLLLARNRPVAADTLADALWGERAPSTAAAILQNRVSQLRKLLGADALSREPAGYRLRVDDEALDLARFERLAAEGSRELDAGRWGRAAARLAEALALWRGAPLSDFTYLPFAQTEIARLEELRLGVLEDLADAELASGRAAALVPELEARAAQHPLRERTCAQLMRALYQTGRQAEALELHGRTRRALVDELGLEPGRELQELARAILNHDPALTRPTTAAPTRLPVPVTALIGRARELEELVALLSRADVRLVTIGGPGGVGKTRLALAVGGELAADFPGGAVFVDIAPVREPDLVLPTIARALELVEDAGRESLERAVARRLAERPTLLLFDNFEQVADASPLVAELLRSCEGLKALVTSRVPLRLSGEREYELAPLPEADAIALLAERVRAVRPDLDLEESAPEAARAICRRLDALPLALELAATRFRVLSPEALLAKLERSLDLLTEGPRDLPERQQTLRAAVAWSFDMLDVREQRLLARLAIFAGGCTLEATAAVCGDEPSLVDDLGSLVGHSLVRRVGGEGSERFVLLEMIREFALERLTASGELAQVGDRHTEWVARVCEAAWDNWLVDGTIGREAAAAELDNIRAALRRVLDGGSAERALELAGALYPLWRNVAPTEGRAWLEDGLAALGSRPAASRPLFALAGLLWPSGEYERADDLLRRATVAAQACGDEQLVRRSLAARGGVAFAHGERSSAAELIEEAATLARAAGDVHVLYRALNILAGIRFEQEEFTAATALLLEARELARDGGDLVGEASLLANLARIALVDGDVEGALKHAEKAVAQMQRAGSPYLRGHAALALALANLDAGRFGDARAWFATALDLEEPPNYAPTCLLGLAAVEADTGRELRAARLFGAASSAHDRFGSVPDAIERRIEGRLLDGLRTRLGADWHAEEAAGRALSLDDAIALATS